MLRINQIQLSLEDNKELLLDKCAKKLRIPKEEILSMRIFKESIDARHHDVHFSYTVDVEVKEEKRFLKYNHVHQAPDLAYHYPSAGEKEQKGDIYVAGFGPAGMYAALLLAQMGYAPHVIERGGDVDERIEKVEKFWSEGCLDEDCNVQFGEGGAGTFSDGKLTTRSKDLRSRKVLEEFVRFGAPEEILYQAHPHIGTDVLRGIVKNIRKEILRLGGTIDFHSELQDVKIEQGRITEIKVQDTWHPCAVLILAIGHSARSTFAWLHERNVAMEAKAFAVGVRVEHPQSLIDEAQYKEFAHHPKLPAAEYRLTHTAKNGRGVYTFCMCPGGSVVASASEKGGIVINGMSEHARDKENANSAVLVQVQPEDFSDGVLGGIAFQRELEQKAFALGGKNYHAPVQRIQDYLNQTPTTTLGSVKPTYQPDVTLCDLHTIFPSYINEALHEGLLAFEQKLKGFTMGDAIMTGVETRSSSPVRILRDNELLESQNVAGLYPCGEGAGYAGGIVSAAIDGLRCAEKIIETYRHQ